jgi:hypothetical protein
LQSANASERRKKRASVSGFVTSQRWWGIQKQQDGTWFSGKIKPDVEKYFATIKEVFPDGMGDSIK